ncbi:MAG: TrkA family potassium uptake protein [Ruminococcaceae bacterium]|nr:TrkA family potassium uptake protein [Oscillospiraceae bacterium]
MSMQKNYAVFGLGRYGTAVAQELAAAGAEVLAVDRNQGLVNSAAATIPLVKCADITDPEVFELLGISNMDVVIVAMGNHLEESVMAVMLCKEAGVPTVIAKCANETHGRILQKVGADQTIIPEQESGFRLAKNLLSSGFVDVMELTDKVSLIELDVRQEWQGKSLADLNLRKKYGINVVALRSGEDIAVALDPSAPLEQNQKLVIIADTDKLRKLKA